MSVQISLTFEYLFCKYFVRRSDNKRHMETRYSLPLIKIHDLFFSVHIPLIYENLFYEYFVCQSGDNGQKYKIWKRDFLGPLTTDDFFCAMLEVIF